MRSTASALTLMFAAVATGALVMVLGGAGVGRWAVHLATGGAGVVFALLVSKTGGVSRRASATLVIAASVAVAATLASSDLEGVRRWHFLGPLRVNASSLFAPGLVVACALETRWHARVVLAGLQLVHVLQPDAAQATAVGATSIVLALRDATTAGASRRGVFEVASGLLHAALVIVAWSRPDPLAPVAFVEDVVARAREHHAGLAAVALSSLAASIVAPLVPRSTGRASSAAWALTAYFAGAAVASALGAFPVPLIGFSPSTVLGAFVAMGLLFRSLLSVTAPSSH